MYFVFFDDFEPFLAFLDGFGAQIPRRVVYSYVETTIVQVVGLLEFVDNLYLVLFISGSVWENGPIFWILAFKFDFFNEILNNILLNISFLVS